jgi:4-hydroxy-2-oxoglutarate aldolase
MISLKGIFPPLPTSFDSAEKLAPEKIRENIRALCRFELAGFLILGSNGELVMLTEEEKIQAFHAAREAIPADRIMLAGTGGQSTGETIRLTREAARAGADGVLVLNPFYYKGLMTRQALVAHYQAVAEASEIPVIVYNMPGNTGMDMDADTILAVSDHPNIVGLKDSGGNVVKLGAIAGRAKQGFQVMAGSAGFLLPALAMGAVGGILALANIAPAQCLEIFAAFHRGEMETARRTQQQMIPVNAAVTSRWGVPALKAAMDHIGLYGGSARRPVLPLDPETKKQLIELLNKNNIRL